MDSPLYAVLLAGGGGTRFWPASRRALPKQFLSLGSDLSLLAATRERLASQVPDERVLVVAGASQAALVREVLPDLPEENLLLEPTGRNTLPAVALAAAEVRRRDPNALQAILPADHVIEPESAFLDSLAQGCRVAQSTGRLVTFGIQPTYPATGYGYIEQGEAIEGGFDVSAFHEKPELERAKEYLATGRFLWNAGMFVWTTEAICGALEQHTPATWSALKDATGDALVAAYEGVDGEPIDIGVMEKHDQRAVVPVDYTWNDVGGWKAVAEVTPLDDAKNAILGSGDVRALDSSGNVVWAEDGTVTALIGVEDLVVVRSGNAVLVCPKDRAEEVKQIVEGLGDEFR